MFYFPRHNNEYNKGEPTRKGYPLYIGSHVFVLYMVVIFLYDALNILSIALKPSYKNLTIDAIFFNLSIRVVSCIFRAVYFCVVYLISKHKHDTK